jgi:hypothetical protein
MAGAFVVGTEQVDDGNQERESCMGAHTQEGDVDNLQILRSKNHDTGDK